MLKACSLENLSEGANKGNKGPFEGKEKKMLKWVGIIVATAVSVVAWASFLKDKESLKRTENKNDGI